ncbi:GNAT family N-acetyltransferase [Saccharibacillus alkalitolerans]|uniref:GNAT family N-acetyltransferase n=1 Tax=Saccharibacillus alkalitolerans TaxID=2705290 RepID=A0ABX0F0P5_9BACL|nr:GNAT family N-acetyltransferase [Saccharibacillus alkalitolerans]NGZ74557.1 GNAT family N-acetyltransferase [Saccharibacillus alkalitolerans]
MKRQDLRLEKEIVKTVRMDYQLYLPSGYEKGVSPKAPLIVYLHGAGGSGAEPELVRREGLPARAESGASLPFVIAAPQCPIGVFWNTQEDEVLAILDEVEERWNIDPERVYLTGYSMGAYGVWHLAVHHPKRFAAIAPVSGGGDPAYAKELRTMPAWIFHGTDDEIIHASESEKIAEAMREAGAEVELTLYPGSGHDCWKKVYSNEALYRWFLEHTASGRHARKREEAGEETDAETDQSGAKRSDAESRTFGRTADIPEEAAGEAAMVGERNEYPSENPADAFGDRLSERPQWEDGTSALGLYHDGTQRLNIEPVGEEDIDDLFELEAKNKEFFRGFAATREELFYTRSGQTERVRRAIEASAVDQRYLFLVRERATGKLIGSVDLMDVSRGSLQSAWIGYFMDKEHNGKGYMTEAIRFVVRHAFEVLALHRIEAGVMPHNEGSLRVLEKAGFQREGLTRSSVKIDGRWRDHVLLAILNPKDTAEEGEYGQAGEDGNS